MHSFFFFFHPSTYLHGISSSTFVLILFLHQPPPKKKKKKKKKKKNHCYLSVWHSAHPIVYIWVHIVNIPVDHFLLINLLLLLRMNCRVPLVDVAVDIVVGVDIVVVKVSVGIVVVDIVDVVVVDIVVVVVVDVVEILGVPKMHRLFGHFLALEQVGRQVTHRKPRVHTRLREVGGNTVRGETKHFFFSLFFPFFFLQPLSFN